MKKFITITLILLSIFSNAIAKSTLKESRFTFSISPTYFFENGVLNEFVYAYDSNNTLYKMSELNWQIKSSHNIGAAIKFDWKYIFMDSEFSLGFSGNSGTLLDSDWLLPSDHSVKTTYSINKNFLNTNQKLSIRIAGKIPCTPERINSKIYINLFPYLKYDYSLYSFSGYDGYGWYGHEVSPIVAYTDSSAIFFNKLCGIDYVREQTNVFHGILTECCFIKKIFLTVDFGLSLYNHVNSVDTHYNNSNKTDGTNYLDIMQAYFNTFIISTLIKYNLRENLNIGLGYKYMDTGVTTGYNKSKTLNSNSYSSVQEIVSKCSGETHIVNLFFEFIF